MDLKTEVLQMITKQKLVKAGDTLVVGVSGGADSVCLLHILYQLRPRLGIQLHVAHFNHRLRPGADRDELFVKALASQLNLPMTIHRRKAVLNSKIVSEDKARQWRFEFFAKVASLVKAQSIALAHTQNDLAETVLMRLLRGSGLSGLRGILAENTIAGRTFIRPLLSVARKEIEGYLQKHHLKYCQDETNSQTHYFRNKIRLKLLPALSKDYNANISGVLVDLAYTTQADYDYLLTQAEKLFKDKAVCSKGKIRIQLKFFLKQHVSMRRMLLRLSFECLVFNLKQLSFTHIQEVEDMLSNRPVGSVVHWPQAVKVSKSRNELVLCRP